MARILYGSNVADVRGKINGHVFTRNKGGAVVRNKVTPINPNTSHQSTQRTYLGDNAKAWANVLTDAQRTAWQNFGRDHGSVGIFGNKRILSGIAAYQKLNRLILAAGGTRIDDPPVSLDIAGLTSLTLTANHVGAVLSLAFTPAPYAGTQGLYVYATPAISPGISNISSHLRLIGFFAAAASPLSISAAWIARNGAFPTAAGQRIGVSVFALDNATGAITPATVASTLVV